MSSLYELTGARLALQRKLEALELDSETIADTLEGDSAALEDKVEAYCYVLKNLQAQADSTLAEIDRITALFRVRERKANAVRAWLLQNLVACKLSNLDFPAFRLAVRNNPERLVVDDEAMLDPSLFFTPEPAKAKPDNATIKALLRSGESVPGAHLERTQRLEIK